MKKLSLIFWFSLLTFFSALRETLAPFASGNTRLNPNPEPAP